MFGTLEDYPWGCRILLRIGEMPPCGDERISLWSLIPPGKRICPFREKVLPLEGRMLFTEGDILPRPMLGPSSPQTILPWYGIFACASTRCSMASTLSAWVTVASSKSWNNREKGWACIEKSIMPWFIQKNDYLCSQVIGGSLYLTANFICQWPTKT